MGTGVSPGGRGGDLAETSAQTVREQVDRVVRSRTIGKAERLGRFLRFVVDQELEGRRDDLKEYLIAAEVFGRPDYDPAIDSAVRVEASKLRSKLEQYYRTEGLADPIRIEIPKGGYAPVYHVRQSPAPPVEPVRAASWRRMAWAAALTAVTVGAAWVLMRPIRVAADAASLAVLPLANLSGDPQQEYFADGMTEALIADLARIPAVRVISRTSVARYKDARRPLPEIARELNVAHVVEGSVARAGSRVRISAKLIRARDDRSVWSETYERDVEDVLALQSEAAKAIAREIRGRLAAPAPAPRAHRVDQHAYDAYLRGRYEIARRTPRGIQSAREHFDKAVERDPPFALAWAGLADAYILLASYFVMPDHEAYPKARAAAEKALALDAGLAEAHTSLGALIADYYWDWEAADRSFREALRLGPGYALAHQWYAELHNRLGRNAEALREMQEAAALDPLSLIIHTSLGIIHYRAWRFEPALERLRRSAELDPNFGPVYLHLGLTYSALGRHADAVREMKRQVELMPGTLDPTAMLAAVLARAGNAAEARALLDNLLRRRAAGEYLSSVQVAAIYAGLGDHDRAFESLEQAYRERSWFLGYLAREPLFDGLRSDARFQDLLRRLKL
jgi:TolB-like protein/Tfp pilus assembly protein PilF